MPPNVVLIVLDAARRDALEPYGAPPGTTPALAQLASRGIAMRDVYATGCWTVPSHTSLFTGLMPRAAGLSRAASVTVAKPLLEAHSERLVPEVLRRSGYWTAAVSANLWVSKLSGFSTGFEDFVQVEGDRHARMQGDGRRARLRWLAQAALARADDGARRVEATLEGWIERARSRERPFFWFVNLMEAHSPYLPPRSQASISLPDRVRAAEDARRYYTLGAIWQVCSGRREIPEEVLERMRRLYAASVRYMDDSLGRLLERLDDARVLQETLVVVLADHGENLGEGGLIAHALSLDDRLIHVPLVAAGPGAPTNSIQSLANVPRVLAHAAGLEDHPWTDGPHAGAGVAQFDPPLDPDDPEAHAKLVAGGLGEDAFGLFTTPQSCAVANGLKLLRRGEREELYEFDGDPLETQPHRPDDLSGRRDEVAALRRALDQPAMATGRAVGDTQTTTTSPSDEERRDLEERMRLLGYM